MKYKFSFLFILLISLIQSTDLAGQYAISGTITDQNQEALPFATIYVKGTTLGTSSNMEGDFNLPLKAGTTTIIYQYVGYKPLELEYNITEDIEELKIRLEPETYDLEEVLIAADAEDPAYRVIRKAIEKRKYHLNQIDQYSCDVYIKGNQKLLKAPKKVLGQDIGDFDGALDSTRKGIVYLSESIARYYQKEPDLKKEVMYSSKISGDDRGYSFNSAIEMDFNFYENNLNLNRDIVSPIAQQALSYYKYKLIGTQYDAAGRLINQIQVIPKRNSDPVFEGLIYIVEDQWNIHSLDLNVSKKATHIYFVDSLQFKQVYVPVNNDKIWLKMSNSISFRMSGFGFDLKGLFTSVYSDYDLDTPIEDKFFGPAIIKVEKDANERDDTYWESVRPVPLTNEENVDYVRRDSIAVIRKSKTYLDSVDRVNNKFSIGDIFGEYNYRNQYEKFSWRIESPVQGIGFNTVQGYSATIEGRLVKYFDEAETKRFILFPKVSYGFADQQIRAKLRAEYRANRTKRTWYAIEGGDDLIQFNGGNPIGPTMNTLYSLLARRNYAKFYRKQYLRFDAQSELSNGIFLKAFVENGRRLPEINHSDQSYFYKDKRDFTSNDPLRPEVFGVESFTPFSAVVAGIDLTFRIKQKYAEYPDRKFIYGSKWPTINVHLKQGLGHEGSGMVYTFLGASMFNNYQLGEKGYFKFYVNGGSFVKNDAVSFIDHMHFSGNQIQFLSSSSYIRRFLQMPYYDYSTDETYVQAHFTHDFEGWILDKIPGISNLGWSLELGAKYLNTSERAFYYEMHAGFKNLGVGIIRLLRFDFIYSNPLGTRDLGFLIGLNM